MSEYTIEKTSDHTYLDGAGEIVNGKRIRVRLHNFEEIHHLAVPSLSAPVVREAVETLLQQRQELAELG